MYKEVIKDIGVSLTNSKIVKKLNNISHVNNMS
jgi:hypothetical protein